jgi:putative aldouronate transport system substrate-binding protein
MKRKSVAGLLAVVMVFSLLLGCMNSDKGKTGTEHNPDNKPANNDGGSGSNFNPTGMPIVNEPVTIKIYAGKPPTASDWNEVMLWKEYEKMTNVHIEWDPQVPFQDLAEKRNLAMATGDYPEAFYASLFTTADLIKYGGEGVLLPLNDLIDQYAPNVKKLFELDPAIRKGYTMPDGNIYTFPTVAEPDFTSVRVGGRIWLKKEWMDQLGLKEPETPEEFYDVLKRIKEADPAGNGATVPYGGFSAIGPMLIYLGGAWGLYNQGLSNGEFDLDPETGKVRFVPSHPRYREVLELLNRMYADGLFWKDIMTTDYAQVISQVSSGNFFSVYSQDPVRAFNLEGYVGVPALTGPYGDKLYSGVISPILWSGGFVLTKNAKNPEVLVRWIDHLYGDEGSKMFFMGFEGVTYEEKPDGTVDYLDSIKNPSDGLNFDQKVSQYVTWPGGGYPGVVRKAFFKGSEASPASLEATEKIEPYLPMQTWGPFSFTPEENEVLASIGNDIFTYAAEMMVNFVTGREPLSNWDNYIETMNRMGLNELMAVYEAAYARYQAQ